MEVAVVTIAIANESMSSFPGVNTRIENRATLTEFVVDEVLPLLLRVLSLLHEPHACIVVEIGCQRIGNGLGIGARAVLAVVHPDSLSGIAHQCCHGIAALSAVAAGIAAQHGSPVEDNRLQWCTGHVVLGDGRGGLLRPLVIVHDLCHGRCHAPRGTSFLRHLIVIGSFLPPRGGYHGFDKAANLFRFCCCFGDERGLSVLVQPFQLLIIGQQPTAHVLWHGGISRKGTFRIAQHGRQAVVGSSHHETLSTGKTKHIAGLTSRQIAKGGRRNFHHVSPLRTALMGNREECPCTLLSLLPVEWSSMAKHRCQKHA